MRSTYHPPRPHWTSYSCWAPTQLATPGAGETHQPGPWRITPPPPTSLEQHHPCQCNQGVRTAPSRVWSMATPCHRQ